MYYFAYYNFELIIRYLYFQKGSLDGLIDKTQIIHHISQKKGFYLYHKRGFYLFLFMLLFSLENRYILHQT